MRRGMFVGMIFLPALVLWAEGNVKPLNVKVGLWQTTSTIAIIGHLPGAPPETLARMTPEQRARYEAAMQKASQGQTSTRKHSVTQKDLDKDPFGEERKSCTRTVLTSTGSKMEFREVCDEGEGQKSDATVQFEALDSEHVKRTVHANNTKGGQTMNFSANIAGQWLGAACPSTK